MFNVKTISTCQHCKTTGNVIRQKNEFVKLECPKCETKWTTMSEIYPDCKKPNGFATKGACSKCYSERHKIS
jgi:hypothetical protein